MRQVPCYLIIGGGKVASHFKHYFSLLNLQHHQWQRSQSTETLKQFIAESTHALILINDGAIDAFVTENFAKTDLVCVHFSGSLFSTQCFGAHPLMTFSETMYDFSLYQDIPFVVDKGAPEFSDLLPGLPNPHVRLDPSLKNKYHAMCVLSGNMSCLLWQKFFYSLKEDFDMPEEIGKLYLQQQMQNLMKHHANALTGPLKRGDAVTVEKHLQALEGDAFKPIYQSFVDCYQEIKKSEKWYD